MREGSTTFVNVNIPVELRVLIYHLFIRFIIFQAILTTWITHELIEI